MNKPNYIVAAVVALVVLAAFFVGRVSVSTEEVAREERAVADADQALMEIEAFIPSSLSDPEKITLGEELFVENCEACHQEDAIGQPGFAPSLTNPELLSLASDTFFESTIADGREDTGMPPFDYLGMQEIQAIVFYLRSFEDRPNRSAEVDAQPSVPGDARLGQLWYDNICSTCHGVEGDGYLAGGTGTAIGRNGFLSKASDGFIRETIKHGRSNTRMYAFQGADGLADMSDQEIDDTIAYLRQLSRNQ